MDPDRIYDKSFDWFKTWSVTLKLEGEYEERFNEAMKGNSTQQSKDNEHSNDI